MRVRVACDCVSDCDYVTVSVGCSLKPWSMHIHVCTLDVVWCVFPSHVHFA